MKIALCVAWYVSGVASMIYWVTKVENWPEQFKDVVAALLAGLYGPLSFLIGWFYLGDSVRMKHLFKKRKG
jgi:hypothetical protein